MADSGIGGVSDQEIWISELYPERDATDLPEEYAFFNEYDYVTLSQNEKKKDLFDVCFAITHEFSLSESEEEVLRKYYKEIQLDTKEREKFELYLIANPFVEADEKCFVSREY